MAIDIDDEILLSAWRDRRAPTLDAEALERLRTLIGDRLALPLKGWRAAVRETPARAVGLGIDLLAAGRLTGPAADLVFSALHAHAADGNAAADLVLRHALERLDAAAPRAA